MPEAKYYDQKREMLEQSFKNQFKKKDKKDKDGGMAVSPMPYGVKDFSDSDVIVRDWESDKTYKVPYEEDGGKYSFSEKASWKEVVQKTDYVPAEGGGSKEREETVKELHDEA